ncbi:ribonuclease H-like domain-containing protein [Tanacetum coccineum]|uniref:Ribonuclease H-like domain-containing protein n=1 Tax=Tanacetum coccineum TaxID=301880 RepID=A0ABQ4ZRV0_9ASTR
MSVHNSEHNSPLNSHHDDDIHDSIIRISKLDISDPLHLHPNDTTALTVVSIKPKGTKNYQVWSCAMLLALEGKNKIGFIDASCKRSNTYEVLGKQAKHVWEELKETYDKVDGSIMIGLHNQINTLKQNGSSIADYYHKLNALWKQYDAMIELPKCVCNASKGFKKHNQLLKLMQFLMGLDDSYMQIRSSFLSRETLPDVRSAYATISSEESHRVAVGSIAGSSQRNQTSAFVSNMNKWLLLSLSSKTIKLEKNVQADMAEANQHMTYTDKELDNVIDISHLKIKVGHPNGTEAYISKIENLRLSNGLTLYDDLNLKNVLGIGEQCGGLYYYSDKGIKSNTSTLNFQCMLSQHDWHYRLGHPEDPVLNVLKDSLNFDKKDNTSCYEICQRAKQTREPFPLSDHKFFLTVVDDYTRAVWVYLIKSKDEDSEVGENDSTNVLQDVNHINFFDIEYPEIPNDYERVANDLNKGKSDSSSSSKSGSNINTADFPVDSGNDADSSNDFVATQNEEVATLDENIFYKGNLEQNLSSSQGVQNVRRSSRQSVFPKNYNAFSWE